MNYIYGSIITLFFIYIIGCGGSKENNSDTQHNINFRYKNHIYTIVKSKKSWQEAQNSAIASGGYLAEIGTQKENDFILNKDVATALYVSIITDTGYFRWENTTKEIFRGVKSYKKGAKGS